MTTFSDVINQFRADLNGAEMWRQFRVMIGVVRQAGGSVQNLASLAGDALRNPVAVNDAAPPPAPVPLAENHAVVVAPPPIPAPHPSSRLTIEVGYAASVMASFLCLRDPPVQPVLDSLVPAERQVPWWNLSGRTAQYAERRFLGQVMYVRNLLLTPIRYCEANAITSDRAAGEELRLTARAEELFERLAKLERRNPEEMRQGFQRQAENFCKEAVEFEKEGSQAGAQAQKLRNEATNIETSGGERAQVQRLRRLAAEAQTRGERALNQAKELRTKAEMTAGRDPEAEARELRRQLVELEEQCRQVVATHGELQTAAVDRSRQAAMRAEELRLRDVARAGPAWALQRETSRRQAAVDPLRAPYTHIWGLLNMPATRQYVRPLWEGAEARIPEFVTLFEDRVAAFRQQCESGVIETVWNPRFLITLGGLVVLAGVVFPYLGSLTVSAEGVAMATTTTAAALRSAARIGQVVSGVARVLRIASVGGTVIYLGGLLYAGVGRVWSGRFAIAVGSLGLFTIGSVNYFGYANTMMFFGTAGAVARCFRPEDPEPPAPPEDDDEEPIPEVFLD